MSNNNVSDWQEVKQLVRVSSNSRNNVQKSNQKCQSTLFCSSNLHSSLFVFFQIQLPQLENLLFTGELHCLLLEKIAE